MNPEKFVLLDLDQNEIVSQSDSIGALEGDASYAVEDDERSPSSLAVYELSHTLEVKVVTTFVPVPPGPKKKR